MNLTWETAADWDAAQAETTVHHEQPAGTAWPAADVLEHGYSATAPPAPYLGYWPMEESTGTTMSEVSGSGANDGTLEGGVTPGATPAPFGTAAYAFDGASGSRVDLGTGNFTAGTDQSFFWWFYCDGDRSSDNRFLSLQGDVRIIANIGRNATNEIQTWVNGSYRATGATAAPSEWHSLAICYDDAEPAYQAYLDGVQIQDEGLGTPLLTGEGSTCSLGSDDEETQGNFDGRMAHFQAIDAHLSPAQVTTLHDAAL